MCDICFSFGSSDTCILCDCAEGTLNQLYALHGVEETHNILKGLKLILITHMHADHHGVSPHYPDLLRDDVQDVIFCNCLPLGWIPGRCGTPTPHNSICQL